MHHCPTKNILVGTKKDLLSSTDFMAALNDRGVGHVTTEQGQQMAADIKALNYFECSAATGEGLKEVFDYAIKCVLVQKKVVSAGSKKSCTLF